MESATTPLRARRRLAALSPVQASSTETKTLYDEEEVGSTDHDFQKEMQTRASLADQSDDTPIGTSYPVKDQEEVALSLVAMMISEIFV
ncbi:hypothetical protein KC19_VG029400 [Ceratodon purpureus]|uniref:Uncharacterized protein n=1 Tax=Ceratodon purpureus TaxID=3225 RepID=A0A8T0HLF2_CERPU|nr:hypothetical protein KC19_VG029400 [Ceratodon purpureus]